MENEAVQNLLDMEESFDHEQDEQKIEQYYMRQRCQQAPEKTKYFPSINKKNIISYKKEPIQSLHVKKNNSLEWNSQISQELGNKRYKKSDELNIETEINNQKQIIHYYVKKKNQQIIFKKLPHKPYVLHDNYQKPKKSCEYKPVIPLQKQNNIMKLNSEISQLQKKATKSFTEKGCYSPNHHTTKSTCYDLTIRPQGNQKGLKNKIFYRQGQVQLKENIKKSLKENIYDSLTTCKSILQKYNFDNLNEFEYTQADPQSIYKKTKKTLKAFGVDKKHFRNSIFVIA